MSTSLLYREFQRPTAVELSVWCRFTGADRINLCVAKGDVLEVYAVHRTRNEDESEDEDEDEDSGAPAPSNDQDALSSSISNLWDAMDLRSNICVGTRFREVQQCDRIPRLAGSQCKCGRSQW